MLQSHINLGLRHREQRTGSSAEPNRGISGFGQRELIEAQPKNTFLLSILLRTNLDGDPRMQMRIANSLVPWGLDRTLIATQTEHGFAVSRVSGGSSPLALNSVEEIIPSRISIIGRVGPPDPNLCVVWSQSMTFYGNWFDEIAPKDPTHLYRRKVASSSRTMTLSQMKRDDQYALTGSYYFSFRAVMETKRKIPLVLLSDSLRYQMSLPVVLFDIENENLASTLEVLLFQLLKREGEGSETPQERPVDSGIQVDELPLEDFEKYFPDPPR